MQVLELSLLWLFNNVNYGRNCYIPLEKKIGTKFAVVRNGLSFVFAIAIALVMGVII